MYFVNYKSSNIKIFEKYDGIKGKLEMQTLRAIGLHVQRKYYCL